MLLPQIPYKKQDKNNFTIFDTQTLVEIGFLKIKYSFCFSFVPKLSFLFIVVLALLSCNTTLQKEISSSERNTIKYPVIAHAHNDYEQKHPITTALNHGFTSLEVDIVFDETNLIVSHDGEDLDTKGHFETAYLVPLLNRLAANQAPLILLVDIKNYSDQMLAQLNSVLKKHESYLLKREENPSSSKKIQIVLSGDIPRAVIISDKANEFLFIDGRIEDLAFDYSKQYMPMISMNFTDLTNWEGIKKPSKASIQTIQKTIDLVHQKGKKIRFWKTAETELLWRTLIELQVDFIGVDNIENFYATFK